MTRAAGQPFASGHADWNGRLSRHEFVVRHDPPEGLAPEIHLNNDATKELCQRFCIDEQIGRECSELIQGTGCAAGSGSSVVGARST